MDLSQLVTPIILGLVEGATEFLPVSSTGHMIVVGDLLKFNDEKGKVFEIVIQLGAILAVCWLYRERIVTVLRDMWSKAPAQRFALNLLLAFLPAAVLGFLFIKQIKALLFNPTTVAIALIVGAIIIMWIESRPRKATTETVDEVGPKQALLIGFAQAIAMIPGTSRSAATIMGGLLTGLSRQAATEFSFFLAIPTMFAATIYDTWKHREMFHGGDMLTFGVGFVVAFLSSMVAVKALLRFIAHHNFTGFAWYRIAFGILILVLSATGVITGGGD